MHKRYEACLAGRKRAADKLRPTEAVPRADRTRALSRLRPILSAAGGSGRRFDGGMERRGATLILARAEVLSLRVRGQACRIMCVTGRLWVTAERCLDDHVLSPGEGATFVSRGRLVIEALRIATVRIYGPRPVRVTVGSPLNLAVQID